MREFFFSFEEQDSKKKNDFTSNEVRTSKYNLFTFLPLAILYQFDNYFNIFFLVSTVIFSIPQISSIEPSASIAPFSMVIAIAVIREGFEDYKKAKYDKLYNNSTTTQVCRDNVLKETKWKEIKVGDIIKIKKNETVPADIVVLKSSETNGFCYLETTNLDGETALKVKEAIGSTQIHLKNYDNLEANFSIDLPNKEIYQFEGSINITNPKVISKKVFLKGENLLLRSGKLKNVDWVHGLVVYTGNETKIMKNMK